MDKAQKLKKIILSKYKSINSFSKLVDIPSSTLNSAFEKGIGGMAVDRVIRICDELCIDVKTFDPVYQNDISTKEHKILNSFSKLNEIGKDEAIKRVSELTLIDSYSYKINTVKPVHNNNLTEYGYIETIAAHNDHLDEDGEIEKIIEDIEDMKNWEK